MIRMYTRTQCAHCASAKELLTARNINFQEINIEQDPQARDFLLAQGHRSVPQFYVGKELLVSGGWTGLRGLTTEQLIDRISQITNNLGTQ